VLFVARAPGGRGEIGKGGKRKPLRQREEEEEEEKEGGWRPLGAQHPCRPRARHAALSRISLPGLQEQDVRIVRRRHPFASSRIFQGLGFRV